MRNADRTTKGSAASKSAMIEVPFAARRLAYQLGRSQENVIKHALRIGLKMIDANLMENCNPLSHGLDEFNITRAMNKLSPRRFNALCNREDYEPQQILKEEMLRSRGLWRSFKIDDEILEEVANM